MKLRANKYSVVKVANDSYNNNNNAIKSPNKRVTDVSCLDGNIGSSIEPFT